MEKDKKDPFDGEYIGNIWGWKFTLWGLAFILLILGVILYRHWKMGIPFGLEPEKMEINETPYTE